MIKFQDLVQTIPEHVSLLAVSKTRSAAEVKWLYDQGHRLFGENRVQELIAKQAELEEICPEIRWHLIGTLQKNKVRQVVGRVDLIESVHSLDLLREIAKRAERAGIVQDVLLQINYSGEDSKHGFAPDELGCVLETSKTMPSVRIRGLMTMSVLAMTADEKYEFYKAFKQYFDAHQEQYGEASFDTLSMGMSGDYQEAIRAGSNLVRLGTAIFGPRIV